MHLGEPDATDDRIHDQQAMPRLEGFGLGDHSGQGRVGKIRGPMQDVKMGLISLEKINFLIIIVRIRESGFADSRRRWIVRRSDAFRFADQSIDRLTFCFEDE